jgi:hypothetical protein
MKKRCRHERNSWIICYGEVEWCYACGAIRTLVSVDGTNQLRASSTWARPTGNSNKNPFTTWRKASVKAADTRTASRYMPKVVVQ